MTMRTVSTALCGGLLALSLSSGALADPRSDLVGEWVATNPDGDEMLVMILADDGALSMQFDGEGGEPIGSWALIDGKLQLIDDARPEEALLCDYELEEPSLRIYGEGECNDAPPFTRRL